MPEIEASGERSPSVERRIRFLTCVHAGEGSSGSFRSPTRSSDQKRFKVKHKHMHGTRRKFFPGIGLREHRGSNVSSKTALTVSPRQTLSLSLNPELGNETSTTQTWQEVDSPQPSRTGFQRRKFQTLNQGPGLWTCVHVRASRASRFHTTSERRTLPPEGRHT